MLRSRLVGGLAALFVVAPASLEAQTQASQTQASQEDEVVSVAYAALEAVSREDMVALTDLMLDEAFVVAVGGPEGSTEYRSRSRAVERAQVFDADIVERGFDPEVRISGRLATVWLPYDLYVDGAWSHCGIDTFTLLRVGAEWRIASLAYTVEQPPACREHPDGPPGG